MLSILTAVLFVLVAAGTLALGLQWDAKHARSLERLQGSRIEAPRPAAATARASLVQLWRDLVSGVGAMMPASSRDLPLLKRRLVSAGWRNPAAPRYFQGARAVAAVAFGAAGLALALRRSPTAPTC
jgi:hypothetical protein